MSYYVRQITTGPVPKVSDIAAGLADGGSTLSIGDVDADGIAPLMSGPTQIGEVEVNVKGSELFEEEVAEFMEQIEGAKGDVEAVKAVLGGASSIVAVQVLFGDRDPAQVMDDMAPLMAWLQENCPGLTQADADGFYNGQTQILEL